MPGEVVDLLRDAAAGWTARCPARWRASVSRCPTASASSRVWWDSVLAMLRSGLGTLSRFIRTQNAMWVRAPGNAVRACSRSTSTYGESTDTKPTSSAPPPGCWNACHTRSSARDRHLADGPPPVEPEHVGCGGKVSLVPVCEHGHVVEPARELGLRLGSATPWPGS
ncbi:hypothetical protein AB0H12_06335 [Actinosynnema sp. NPDC023794]